MKKSVENVETEGNTKTSVSNKKTVSASKRWAFTLNNYTDVEYDDIVEKFRKNNIKWIIGKEVGEKGTPHLQGYAENEKVWRPTIIGNKRIHWEKCKGDRESNLKYCSKGGKYEIEGMYIKEPLEDPLEEEIITEWQQEILDLMKTKPDKRSIYWYWDEEGGKGKTSLCKHIVIKRNDVLIMGGKSSDIRNGVATWLEEDRNIHAVLIDLVRSQEDRVPYEAIEQLKNGLFYSGKYEGKQCVFNRPHVIVFSNFAPELKRLSLDRWKIKQI